MIKQATVEDIANLRVTKRHGKILVVTRYYPRFLKRKLVDEYFGVLAPTKELLHEFKAEEEKLGDHDRAFEAVDYESKFALGEPGLEKLREIAQMGVAEDVYLVCHCKLGQRCHRELLLLMIAHLGTASTGRVYLQYPTFENRLPGAGVT